MEAETAKFLLTQACCTHPLAPGEQDRDSPETGQRVHIGEGAGSVSAQSAPCPALSFTLHDPGQAQQTPLGVPFLMSKIGVTVLPVPSSRGACEDRSIICLRSSQGACPVTTKCVEAWPRITGSRPHPAGLSLHAALRSRLGPLSPQLSPPHHCHSQSQTLSCVWCKTVVQVHSSACRCPVFPAPLAEETVFIPLGILSCFVTD